MKIAVRDNYGWETYTKWRRTAFQQDGPLKVSLDFSTSLDSVTGLLPCFRLSWARRCHFGFAHRASRLGGLVPLSFFSQQYYSTLDSHSFKRGLQTNPQPSGLNPGS
jgi:hypothetical protein